MTMRALLHGPGLAAKENCIARSRCSVTCSSFVTVVDPLVADLAGKPIGDFAPRGAGQNAVAHHAATGGILLAGVSNE